MKKITLLLLFAFCGIIFFGACSKDDDKPTLQAPPPTFNIDDYAGTYASVETVNMSISMMGQSVPMLENQIAETTITIRKGNGVNKVIMEQEGIEHIGTFNGNEVVFEPQTMDVAEMVAILLESGITEGMGGEISEGLSVEDLVEILKTATGSFHTNITGTFSNKNHFEYNSILNGTMTMTYSGFPMPITIIMTGNAVSIAQKQ